MSGERRLRLGTRGSRLALAQAAIVADGLVAVDGDPVETVVIETHGDRLSRRRPMGGPLATDGQFTAELEAALLDGRIDAAVHSYKDLPTEPRPGLAIAAVLERGDPRDCLVVDQARDGAGPDEMIEQLQEGARIATSSPRRAAQLQARRADLVAVPIRGNVDTRLARLRRGEFEALLVAAAALDRLGLGSHVGVRLPYETMLPAPAQGALSVQCRAEDASVSAALGRLDHAPTRLAVEAERALLRAIGGGCLAALGALGEVHDGRLRLRAAYQHDGGSFARADVTGPTEAMNAVVSAAADALGAGAEAHA